MLLTVLQYPGRPHIGSHRTQTAQGGSAEEPIPEGCCPWSSGFRESQCKLLSVHSPHLCTVAPCTCTTPLTVVKQVHVDSFTYFLALYQEPQNSLKKLLIPIYLEPYLKRSHLTNHSALFFPREK